MQLSPPPAYLTREYNLIWRENDKQTDERTAVTQQFCGEGNVKYLLMALPLLYSYYYHHQQSRSEIIGTGQDRKEEENNIRDKLGYGTRT